VYPTNSSGYRRIAQVVGTTEGTTVNQRGGGLSFQTKPDGGTSLAARMLITEAGLVGIGVTPSANLHVKGVTSGVGIRVEDTGTTDGIYFYENGTQRGVIGYGDSGQIVTGASADSMTVRAENALHFASGADNLRMTIDSAGLVGIGETSPDSPLHISHATAPTVILERTDSSAGKWQFNVSNTTVGDFAISDLQTGSPVHRFMIDASGNVGLSTTDLSASGANAKLGVDSGFINVDDTYGLCWGGGTGRPNISGSKSAGTVTIDNVSVGVGIGQTPTTDKLEVSGTIGSYNSSAALTHYGSSGTTAKWQMGYDSASGTTAGVYLYNNDTDKYLLHVSGDDDLAIMHQGDGNVSIGTATAVSMLTVEGSLTLKEQAAADTDTAAYGQIWVKTGTPNTLYFTDDAGTDVQLGAGGSSVWTTSGSDIYYDTGNVGIGGTPTSPLHVTGTTNDGSTLAQFTQSGTGRGLQVSRNVSAATRQMVSFAQTHATGGTQPVVHIQQSDTGETALAISTDGATENFTVSDVGDVYTKGQIQQAVETLTTGDTVDIDFSLSNLQTFALDGTETQTELTGSNYAAGRTVRLMIDMSNDTHTSGITPPSNWTNFGDDPTSIALSGLVLCELTSWTGADTGVTAYWKESS